MSYLWILLAVSLAVSAVGWFYFIYFFSIGYGLSISALALTIAIVFSDVLTLPSAILCGVLFVYGIRLAGYLFVREKKSASYKKILYQPDNTTKKPFFVMFMIWVSCALLYVGQVSPVSFYLYNIEGGSTPNEIVAWVGSAIALMGFLTETVADAQKNKSKKINANTIVKITLAITSIVFLPYCLLNFTIMGKRQSATPIAESITRKDCDSGTLRSMVM